MPKKKEPNFEDAILRLEEIISQLDSGEAPLEEALTLFEEGAKLLGNCTKLLDQAQEKIALLTPDPETQEPVEQPFDKEENL